MILFFLLQLLAEAADAPDKPSALQALSVVSGGDLSAVSRMTYPVTYTLTLFNSTVYKNTNRGIQEDPINTFVI